MAEVISELNAGIFVVDPWHNLTIENIRNNAEPFINTLCSAHPETPVFMLGAPHRLQSWLKPEIEKNDAMKSELYGRICRKMRRKYPCFHYLKGENFYGSDEVSLDGIHPNDAAFAHMAEILARELVRRTHP